MNKIVKASENDIALLAALGTQTFIESHGHSAAPGDIQSYLQQNYTSEAMSKELSDSNNIYYIIYQNNQPAGFSKIVLATGNPAIAINPLTKLERIYIGKEFYGSGTGLTLLDFNIALSKENKQQGMWLFVWKENIRAISFYQKAGFIIAGSHDFKISATHTNPNHILFLKY